MSLRSWTLVVFMISGFVVAWLASSCGGAGGAPGEDDGGADPGDPIVDAGPRADVFGGGPVITAPPREWTWVAFPASRCMNGSETGVGVNLEPGADRVLIYLEGGGACFNSFTCSGVAHESGFGPAQLTQFAGELGDRGVFDRGDADNPFRDASYVFIPYCTGDIHAGANPAGYEGRQHVGYQNVGVYLERLVPTFQGASQVVLSGTSAGGFGALYNFDRVQRAFGGVEVVMLDDSGPPLSDSYLKPCLQKKVRELWGLNDTLPEGCAGCREGDGGLVNLMPYLADTYPDRRFGLISSLEDGTIRLFYGQGYPSCATPTVPMPKAPFRDGLNQLADEILSPYDNFHVFYIDSGEHGWLSNTPLGGTEVAGVSMTAWIRGLLGGGGWDDVRP